MGYVDIEAKREYQRNWITKRRQDWIDEHGPCVNCGSSDSLEVDHVDPSQKRLSPAALWSLAPDNPKRLEELSKCQVLCHECHLDKTAIQTTQATIAKHNPATMYPRGCRCESCRDYQHHRNLRSRRYDPILKKTVGILQ